jgi:hypothetical protein
MPIPYLPIFVLPFFHAWLFDPIPGFIAFDSYEFVLLLLYMVRFTRALGARYRLEWWWMLPCLPVFLDLLFGNVNIWMILFSGEFLIAAIRRKEILAGAALGLMLLKPQSLVLIGPALILSRSWKMVVGFACSGAFIFLASLAIGGVESFEGIFRIISDYRTDYANYPESMMNLRMVGVNIEEYLSLSVWPSIYMLMGVCCAIGLAASFRRDAFSPDEVATTMLALLTATFTSTWHSQLPMSLMLIPVLAVLIAQGRLPRILVFGWVAGPVIVFAFANIFISLGIAHRSASATVLFFNLVLLFYATSYRFLEKPESTGLGSSAEVGAR